MNQNVMIVEGYRCHTEVIQDCLLCYEDKLRILEKWNQLYAIQVQVYPDKKDQLNTARKETIKLVNQLVKEHIHLHDPALLID